MSKQHEDENKKLKREKVAEKMKIVGEKKKKVIYYVSHNSNLHSLISFFNYSGIKMILNFYLSDYLSYSMFWETSMHPLC